jgi:hypothetical protein
MCNGSVPTGIRFEKSALKNNILFDLHLGQNLQARTLRYSFLDDFKQRRLHVTGGFETTEVDESSGHVCKAGVWKVLSETDVFGQSRPANGHRHLSVRHSKYFSGGL